MGIWLDIDIEFLRKRGLDTPADYADRISAMTFPEAAAYTKKRFGLHEDAADIMQEWNSMAVYAYGNTVQMKPGARDYLSALRERGVKLAVATSSIPDFYVPALRKHGIYDWFQVICTAEEAKRGKSHPDIFLLTAQRLGVAPKDCVVFEDILAAVKSAKSVGMTVCGVYDEASAKDWEQIKKYADYTIRDFREA
jgi:HAD superfamily hydrolase (TIGR01509 family)